LYCIFLLGHLLLSFDHCFVSNVFTKVSFQDVFIELLSLFFLLFCSWKWIRIWVYQAFTRLNKKCFTQILKIFHLVNN
jgi:hypothetical protein